MKFYINMTLILYLNIRNGLILRETEEEVMQENLNLTVMNIKVLERNFMLEINDTTF